MSEEELKVSGLRGAITKHVEMEGCSMIGPHEVDLKEGRYKITVLVESVKDVFEAPCRFGGTCTDKKLYEDCVKDTRIKNNWMCWRDGILKREDVPLEFKGARP